MVYEYLNSLFLKYELGHVVRVMKLYWGYFEYRNSKSKDASEYFEQHSNQILKYIRKFLRDNGYIYLKSLGAWKYTDGFKTTIEQKQLGRLIEESVTKEFHNYVVPLLIEKINDKMETIYKDITSKKHF